MVEHRDTDLTGSHFRNIDLSGSRLRSAFLRDVVFTDAWIEDVRIEGHIASLVVNGVDVTDFVEAELDRRHPERLGLRPEDVDGVRRAWSDAIARSDEAVTRARRLPPDLLDARVDDEYSFVQTLRHLVFAMDKWFTAPVLGEPFHPIGMPNTGSVDQPWEGLDGQVSPSVSEALAVRAARATRLRDFCRSVAQEDFTRSIDVLENGAHPLQECIYTVFEEEFWHNRYARRDLERLEAAT